MPFKCCCCPCPADDPLPEASIPGFTGGGWSGYNTYGDQCCAYQIFNPNTVMKTTSCSDVVDTYTITFTCDTTFYAGKASGGATPPSCAAIAANPCLYCPTYSWETWGSSSTTHVAELRTKVYGYAILNSIRVWLMRRYVECSSQQVCKWMLILEYNYSYGGKWLLETSISIAQSTSPGDCMVKPTPPRFDGGCTVDKLIDCSYDPPYAPGGTLCSISGEICLTRVKFFDDKPSGAITFTSADIPGACSLPSDWPNASCPTCNDDIDHPSGSPNWASSVSLETDVLCPPDWCTNPPYIVATTQAVTFGWECCHTAAALKEDCCDDSLLTLCYPPPLEPLCCEDPAKDPITRNFNCFEVVCPQSNPSYEPECDCAWGSSIDAPDLWRGCPGAGMPLWFECDPSNVACGEGNPVYGSCIQTLCCNRGGFPFVLKYDCGLAEYGLAGGRPPCTECCVTACVSKTFLQVADPTWDTDIHGCERCFSSVGTGITGAGTVLPKDSTASLSITCDNGSPPDFSWAPPNITITLV